MFNKNKNFQIFIRYQRNEESKTGKLTVVLKEIGKKKEAIYGIK